MSQGFLDEASGARGRRGPDSRTNVLSILSNPLAERLRCWDTPF